MKNNSINPKIIANQRVTYFRDLKSAVNLKNFISELDQRYGVDSSDPNNSFGRIFLDDAIISFGVENTLFLAHADGTQASVKVLPKHKKLPTGVPYGEILAFKIKKENQVVLSDDDLLQLNSLRQLFTKEVKENSYLYPEITTQKEVSFTRKILEVTILSEVYGDSYSSIVANFSYYLPCLFEEKCSYALNE